MASQVAQMVNNLPSMWETWVHSLCWEGPLEEGMATHSSIHAQRIPWTEEPGRPQSMGSQRVEHDWATKHTHILLPLMVSRPWFPPLTLGPQFSSWMASGSESLPHVSLRVWVCSEQAFKALILLQEKQGFGPVIVIMKESLFLQSPCGASTSHKSWSGKKW